MVSECKGEQKRRKLFNQRDEFADDFVIRQDNHVIHTERRADTICENVVSSGTNHLTLVNGSQIDEQTLEQSITDRVPCEVNNVVATVETAIHDSILAPMDTLVIPRL